MLLDVVEAKGEDLNNDLKEDFGPRLFFRFLFHKSTISNINKNFLSRRKPLLPIRWKDAPSPKIPKMFPKLLAVVTNIIADLEAGLF